MSLSFCYAIKLTQVKFPQIKDRKRKRSQEDKPTLPSSATPSQKWPRMSPPQPHIEDTTGENVATSFSGNHRDASPNPLSDEAEHTPSKYERSAKHTFSAEDTSNIKDSNVNPVTC